jgi:hypothetical protein
MMSFHDGDEKNPGFGFANPDNQKMINKRGKLMTLIYSFTRGICCFILCGALLLCTPVMAADAGIVRSVEPALSETGGMVNITVTLPPSFFGAIREQLPEGYTYAGTSHPGDGVRQSGQSLIFAVTGEDTVRYSITAPQSGCGVIRGTWENVGTKTRGEIPATVLAVTGSDPSHCSTAPHTPGFSGPATLAACALIGIAVFRKVNQ